MSENVHVTYYLFQYWSQQFFQYGSRSCIFLDQCVSESGSGFRGILITKKCDIRFFLEAVQLSMLGEKPSALKKNIQQTSTSKHKMSSLISIFGGNYCSILDSDPDPDDQNQSGSMLLP
jgi:hypothetical protein